MDNIINIMDKDISIIETFYLILIEKLIEKNKELFIIPENKKGPETKAKIWSMMQTNITTMIYNNINFKNEPIFHLNSSDILLKTYDAFLNIDVKTVLEKDSDSKFNKICLRTAQTSINKFYLKDNKEINGLLNPFEDGLPNLSYIIKIVYDENYNTKEIHIYCIPNGNHPKYKNILKCKIQPKSKDGIRLDTDEIFDKYYLKIIF